MVPTATVTGNMSTSVPKSHANIPSSSRILPEYLTSSNSSWDPQHGLSFLPVSYNLVIKLRLLFILILLSLCLSFYISSFLFIPTASTLEQILLFLQTTAITCEWSLTFNLDPYPHPHHPPPNTHATDKITLPSTEIISSPLKESSPSIWHSIKTFTTS